MSASNAIVVAPRRRRRGRRGRGRVSMPSFVRGPPKVACSIQGTTYFAVTFSAQTVIPLTLYPGNIGVRANDLFNAFEFYRYRAVRFRFMPNPTTACGVGYWPDVPATPPTGLSQVSEGTRFNMSFANQTTPTELLLDRKVLIDDQPTKWWATSGSVFPSQGTLYFAASPSYTGDIVVEVAYDVEFSGPVFVGATVEDDEKWHPTPPPTPSSQSSKATQLFPLQLQQGLARKHGKQP